MEHVANDFKGNKQTLKTNFALSDLTTFESKAQTLAHALDEFVTIERHVELAGWKKARLAPPERRMVAGETLVVRYLESDQDAETVERNRDNEVRRLKYEAWKAANPDAKKASPRRHGRNALGYDRDALPPAARLRECRLRSRSRPRHFDVARQERCRDLHACRSGLAPGSRRARRLHTDSQTAALWNAR
jgi:hypothetical protein